MSTFKNMVARSIKILYNINCDDNEIGMDNKQLYEGKGCQPVYTRTALTDALHDAFGFCTSKQIIPVKVMRNICSVTKNP